MDGVKLRTSNAIYGLHVLIINSLPVAFYHVHQVVKT